MVSNLQAIQSSSPSPFQGDRTVVRDDHAFPADDDVVVVVDDIAASPPSRAPFPFRARSGISDSYEPSPTVVPIFK